MKRVAAILITIGLIAPAMPGFSADFCRHHTALCASVTRHQPDAWVLAKLGPEFFEQQNVQTLTDYPVAIRSTFTKGQDHRIFVVSRWYGFDPQRQYDFSCEWIGPDGQSYTTSSASFETPSNLDPSIFFTYTAYLDVQNELPDGRWTVNILLNGDLVDVKDLTIASF